jgi:hypothetical protein
MPYYIDIDIDNYKDKGGRKECFIRGWIERPIDMRSYYIANYKGGRKENLM